MRAHIGIACAFVLFAIVWTYPLVTNVSTQVLGQGPADNISFVWNIWWARQAMASGHSFFFTEYLFAPFGTDLTLHAHTALAAFVGSSVFGSLPVVSAENVLIGISLVLNAYCAYFLAWRLTRDVAASAIAGLIFGGSPYISAHLNGHFNLTSAWTVPLFALAITNAMSNSTLWAVVAGAVLGMTIYVDYYYVVYQVAFAVCAAIFTTFSATVHARGATHRSRQVALTFAVVALLDLALMIGITATGGFEATVGPIRILARDIFNPLQAFWLLLGIALYGRSRPSLRITQRDPPRTRAVLGRLSVMLVTGSVFGGPIIFRGLDLVSRGEYVSQTYFWRSAPKGVDLSTLILGNPFHGLWGPGIQSLYRALGIDIIEGGAWLGIVPLALSLYAVKRHRQNQTVRYWSFMAAIFFIWALGPHLMAFGRNTGLILPQTLIRYIPLASNARIPGRAMVVVYLAVAVLAAAAIAAWKMEPRRRTAFVIATAALIGIDWAPTPFPVFAIDHPRIYEILRYRRESGSVLELPLGIRDGFSNRGFFDHRVLAYQTIHGRPIAGGFVARLSPTLLAAHASDPLLDSLLILSEREGKLVKPPPERSAAAERLRASGVSFVMLNRDTAPAQLIQYVDKELPLYPIATEGSRTLYSTSRESN